MYEMYQGIPTPGVVIHLDTACRNIEKMVEQNRAHGIAHRPHIKPHKSVFLAKKQLELGAQGITCAKLGEAEVMAEAGIRDILIAFPLIGQDKWDRYEALCRKADPITIVNTEMGAEGLSLVGEKLGKPVRVLIEVDSGLNRGGIPAGQPTLDFANRIKDLPGLDICGIMYYAGIVYGADSVEEALRIIRKEHDDTMNTAQLLREAGFKMDILSAGNSFSGKHPELMEGVTEVRSGNYIFNDCAQLTFGMVGEEDCSLRVIATVVATPDSHTAIIDAGSKSLCCDLCPRHPGYGWVVGHPEIEIYKVNEEHGFLRREGEMPFVVGQKIAIIPNHACVIPNTNELVFGMEGDKVVMELAIEARMKGY